MSQPNPFHSPAASSRARCRLLLGTVALAIAIPLFAQEMPKLVIDETCQAFAIAPNSTTIAYAVPRIKHVKRLYIERDDIFISEGGKSRRIVDAEKFMPFPPPVGYVINSMRWSPNGKRLALDMTLQQPPEGYEIATGKNKGKEQDTEDRSPVSTVGGGRVVGLLDDDGSELKVAGSKTRFIEEAKNAAWLGDNQTVVYQGGGSNQIARVKLSDGKIEMLFDGRAFDAIAWDTARDRAFAIGRGIRGQTTVMQLDLLHERIAELAHIENYQGQLTLSASGKKLGFFEDGDTVDTMDVANPSRIVRTRVGYGHFEFSGDENRILLKRGPDEKSNSLLWVNLDDGSFTSTLHDLTFRDFALAPDGESLIVTQPGTRVLKVFPAR